MKIRSLLVTLGLIVVAATSDAQAQCYLQLNSAYPPNDITLSESTTGTSTVPDSYMLSGVNALTGGGHLGSFVKGETAIGAGEQNFTYIVRMDGLAGSGNESFEVYGYDYATTADKYYVIDVRLNGSIYNATFAYWTPIGSSGPPYYYTHNNPSYVNFNSFPFWFKLTRSGSTYTAYSSPDGSTWTEIGQPYTNSQTPTEVYAGLLGQGAPWLNSLGTTGVRTLASATYDELSINGNAPSFAFSRIGTGSLGNGGPIPAGTLTLGNDTTNGQLTWTILGAGCTQTLINELKTEAENSEFVLNYSLTLTENGVDVLGPLQFHNSACVNANGTTCTATTTTGGGPFQYTVASGHAYVITRTVTGEFLDGSTVIATTEPIFEQLAINRVPKLGDGSSFMTGDSTTISTSVTPTLSNDFAVVVLGTQASIGQTSPILPSGYTSINADGHTTIAYRQLTSTATESPSNAINSAEWAEGLVLLATKAGSTAAFRSTSIVLLSGAILAPTQTLVPANPYLGGSTVLVCLRASNINTSGGTPTITSITDTQSNTYVRLGAVAIGGGPGGADGAAVEVWGATNVVGGTPTITVKIAGSGGWSGVLGAYEFTGAT